MQYTTEELQGLSIYEDVSTHDITNHPGRNLLTDEQYDKVKRYMGIKHGLDPKDITDQEAYDYVEDLLVIQTDQAIDNYPDKELTQEEHDEYMPTFMDTFWGINDYFHGE